MRWFICRLPNTWKSRLKKNRLILEVYQKILSFSQKDYQSWQYEIEPACWLPTLDNQTIKFSIVVPVYNPSLDFLKVCVESVFAQNYSNWQLILVNDASTCRSVNAYLSELADKQLDNVDVVFNSQNQHICQASNKGIDKSTGDYIVFLDHDDELAPQALNELAAKFIAEPSLKWVYSDEDLMTEKGRRVIPHFKSRWNPYLLQAHNYITHLCAYDKRLIDKLGGFRPGFEGAQDYDLALRASRELKPEQIGHIAKVIYHWRIHDNSTASSSNAKPYTHKAGKQALQDHLEAMNIAATVQDGDLDNFFKVNYQPTAWPKVSIIVPTRDNKAFLKACVDSVLKKTNYPDFEIIVMDNQSQAVDAVEYLNTLNDHKKVRVIEHNKAFNYSEINNRAVELASGEIVVLLNNDTEVISNNWLTEMVGLAMQSDVGCVGAKLLYSDKTIQHAGVILGLGGYAAHSHRGTPHNASGYFNRANVNQVLSAVTGACLAIRKETYQQVSGLDEAFKVAYNDVDFCLKVQQAGFFNVYCPHAVLYHYESKTRGEDNNDAEKSARFDKEKKRLLEKWQPIIENDPYYNPNLTRAKEDFSINMDKR
ncbi:Glyco_trans_2-like domain-containing protein [Vibrio chagasii]|nr:Glyco_trans_2-like domain-containing protein [Vibrio chagasii]CAH7017475.1 Glyco_trans_2-like domain-containing protein [Vibrio chagasii]CAH7053518.1 Glyco_trans_2-like domain-containing protein [Vibrio chagasii]